MTGIIAGCASQRPVLYPNSTLQTAGPARAERAVDDCVALAKSQGAQSNKGERVAKRTAEGGAVGAASGAAVGAVFGAAGKGAAAGAAGGASRSAVRGAFDADDPSPLFKRFVERCLRDKGYEPVGWR